MKKGNFFSINKTNLQILREESGLLQKDFSELFGITERTYGRIERAQHPNMQTRHLYTMADKLNVSTDYILNRSTCRSVENDFINKVTGLSDASITCLDEMSDTESNLLDILIKKGYFDNIALAIFFYMQTAYKNLILHDDSAGDGTVDDIEKMDIAEYRASKIFLDVLVNSIANDLDIMAINDKDMIESIEDALTEVL